MQMSNTAGNRSALIKERYHTGAKLLSKPNMEMVTIPEAHLHHLVTVVTGAVLS